MSFDLFAQGFKDGEADDRPESRPIMLTVLQPFVVHEEGGEFWRTRIPDGGGADFYLGGPATGFMVNHFSGGQTLDLIVRAASSAGLAILGPGLPPAVTKRDPLGHLPEELLSDPAPVLIESGEELAGVIAGAADIIGRCRERLL